MISYTVTGTRCSTMQRAIWRAVVKVFGKSLSSGTPVLVCSRERIRRGPLRVYYSIRHPPLHGYPHLSSLRRWELAAGTCTYSGSPSSLLAFPSTRDRGRQSSVHRRFSPLACKHPAVRTCPESSLHPFIMLTRDFVNTRCKAKEALHDQTLKFKIWGKYKIMGLVLI